MRIVIDKEDVVKGVKQFHATLAEDGVTFDLNSVDHDELLTDIQDEYDTGADGSVLDVIVDLFGSVGLEDYGIDVVENE